MLSSPPTEVYFRFTATVGKLFIALGYGDGTSTTSDTWVVLAVTDDSPPVAHKLKITTMDDATLNLASGSGNALNIPFPAQFTTGAWYRIRMVWSASGMTASLFTKTGTTALISGTLNKAINKTGGFGFRGAPTTAGHAVDAFQVRFVT